MVTNRSCAIPNLSFRCIDSGRLLLLNVIGAGTFGTVYRARDRTSSIAHPVYYAVKVLRRGGTTHWREVHHHLRVSAHPNIVQMHAVLHDEEYIYIILDYCPGGNMFSLITRKRFFAKKDELIRNLFLQLIDGVQSCHAQGIFHRDLKPENILVSEDLTRAWVADFGLATRTRFSKHFGAGSTLYMSPECLNAEGDALFYDARRGDIWALGITLINMVSGRAPWRRASLDDDCFSVYLQDPEFLRRQVPISTTANGLLRDMMPPNAKDVIDLREVRKRVEAIDTFYMSEAELEQAPDQVRTAWQEYEPSSRLRDLSPSEWTESEPSFNSLEDDSDDSDEREIGPGTRTLLYMEEGLLDVSSIFPPQPKLLETERTPSSHPCVPIRPAAPTRAPSAEEKFFTTAPWLQEELSNFIAPASSYCDASGNSDGISFPATPDNGQGMDDARLVAVEDFQGIGAPAVLGVSISLEKGGIDGIQSVRRVVDRFIID